MTVQITRIGIHTIELLYYDIIASGVWGGIYVMVFVAYILPKCTADGSIAEYLIRYQSHFKNQ